MKNLHIKAILFGLLTDLVATFVLTSIMVIIVGPNYESAQYTLSMISGSLAVLAGGYVATKYSPSNKYLNSSILKKKGSGTFFHDTIVSCHDFLVYL